MNAFIMMWMKTAVKLELSVSTLWGHLNANANQDTQGIQRNQTAKVQAWTSVTLYKCRQIICLFLTLIKNENKLWTSLITINIRPFCTSNLFNLGKLRHHRDMTPGASTGLEHWLRALNRYLCALWVFAILMLADFELHQRSYRQMDSPMQWNLFRWSQWCTKCYYHIYSSYQSLFLLLLL